MAEDIFSGPQSDTKHQKLLECILTGNIKLYLGKVYTEDQLKILSEEEVEKLFTRTLNHKYVFDGSLYSARNKRSGCSE